MNNKVLIGCCTRGSITAGTTRFLTRQKQEYDIIVDGDPIAATITRSIIARKFLKGKDSGHSAIANTDYTHLFFLDDDIKPPNDCIERLLKHDKDVVEADYLLFLDGHLHPAAYERAGDNKYISLKCGNIGLHEVHAIGLGACLIKRKVMEECIKNKCFELELEKDGRLAKGEDVIFSEVAKGLGFQLYYDFDTSCEHYKILNLRDIETLITS